VVLAAALCVPLGTGAYAGQQALGAVALSSLADSPGNSPSNRPGNHREQNSAQKAQEIGQLRQAYAILAKADHDYDGHRIRAMHAVERACDVLGQDIRGDGKDVQPQATSDEELRQAQGIIQGVESDATSNKQERVARHLAKAVSEIEVALSVK
jgi:hypothetical protein